MTLQNSAHFNPAGNSKGALTSSKSSLASMHEAVGNWQITYYNERVQRDVWAMPAGIVADYLRLTEAMTLYCSEMRVARKRLKDVQHG